MKQGIMKQGVLKSGLLLLWRDWKSGELTLLAISVLLAIATMTSIGLFTNRIEHSIEEEATHFLAADAQIRGSIPIPDHWHDLAVDLNVDIAQTISFSAMAFAGEYMQLASIKAVSSGYPLKGALGVSTEPYGKIETVQEAPLPGEAWLVSRLFSALNISVGDKIDIGNVRLKVAKVLVKEPDSAQAFFGVSPRIIINEADISKTGAVRKGSRIHYAWMLKGDSHKIEKLKNGLKNEMGHHFRWVGVKDGNKGISDALSRAENFLLLAGCLSIVLLGMAIAMSSRRYANSKSSQVALLKTFGRRPKDILLIYGFNLFVLGCVGFAGGAILGWLLHQIILYTLGSILPGELEPASYSAYFSGGFAGFVALIAFAGPPFLSLYRVSPNKILSSQTENVSVSKAFSLGFGFLAIYGLVYWYSGSVRLSSILLAGSVLACAGIAVISFLLLKTSRVFANIKSKAWRLGVLSLQRHKQLNMMQIVVFSVLFMLLFILVAVRTNLISQWQNQLPENTPNHFLFNVFSNEKNEINEFFRQRNIDYSAFYPMARGRIIEVAGMPIADIVKNYRGSMNYKRELNLTWSKNFGKDNEVTSGEPWLEEGILIGKSYASVEQEYAKGLGIEVGDQLKISVAGSEFFSEVRSIRSVQWDSMNPNFFIIFNQPIVDNEGINWLTSFYLTDSQKPFLNALSRRFPTVTFIEVDQMIKQVQSIISKVSLVVEFILLLVLVAGILVLITSVQATLDIRIRESAVLRALGAQKSLVSRALLVEFSVLGGLAGTLAVIGAETCLYFLHSKVFNLAFFFSMEYWLIGPVIGVLLIGGIGFLSTRKVSQIPPLAVLSKV